MDLAKPKSGALIFFPHVSRAQRLAPARTRTRVVRLGAQCTDHWTTGQINKSSTLYGRTTKFFRLDGLLLFCIIMGLRSASSAIIQFYIPSRTYVYYLYIIYVIKHLVTRYLFIHIFILTIILFYYSELVQKSHHVEY